VSGAAGRLARLGLLAWTLACAVWALPRFEANVGQAPGDVRFLVRSADYVLLVRRDAGMEYLLRSGKGDESAVSQVWVDLAGGNPAPSVEGEERLPGVTHYLLGPDPRRWVRGAPAYGRVRCRGVYPGVDLLLRGEERALEFDFEIAPGADPAQIRMCYRGASSLRVDPAGDLVARVGPVELRWERPRAWQEIGGSRREVPVSYSIGPEHTVSFRLGAYLPDVPLVIDPLIRYSTYLGGGQFDAAFGVAVDAGGAAHVVGETYSVQFPAGSTLSSQARASKDAFIAKLNAAGSALEYLVFLGGTQSDSARAVAVDSAGNAYVAGVTSSADFPTTAGAWRRTHGGLEDGFAVKLGPGGNLIYSTFVGAGGSDFAVAIAADGAGCAYVAGYTSSLSFPVTSGAYQSSYRGGYYDGFVVKLDAAGSAAVYATLLGGSRNDIVLGIAVDGAGAAWVGGQTDSADFPVVSAAQTQLGGSSDGFVAKLSPAGGTLLVSTYLGGSASDAITAVAVDGSGACYVAGWTASGNFPVSSGALQRTYAGSFDAVVVKLAATGGTPAFATYLGGSASDQATAVRVDGAGNVWVAGFTRSLNFPLRNASGAFRGEEDGFLSVLNAAGAGLVYSDLLGGSGQDRVYGMALDAAANAWLTGFTLSADFPTTPGSFRPSPAGAGDGYVSKVAVNFAPNSLSVSPSSGSGWSQTFQFVASDPNGWQDISWGLMLINRVFSGSGGCYMYFNVGARALLLANDAGTGWIQGVVGSGTIENSQCVVRLSESSFSGEGTTFRVTVALTFKAGFEGAKGVYLEVEDYGGLRAVWRQVGTWTVGVNQAPGGLAVNPSSGSGWSQTFQFVASDPNGWQDISWGLMLINRVFSGSGGCYMYFNVGARALLLANDAGTGWIQGVVGSGTIENSQCVVRLSESSFSGEGTTFRVTVALTFKAGFEGAKGVYLEVEDYGGLRAVWRQVGTWTVGVNQAPGGLAVNPSSGSGWSQTFQFVASDPNGWQDISWGLMLINRVFSGSGGCYMYFNVGARALLLANDAGTGWIQGVVGSGTIENSQCVVRLSESSFSGEGTTFRVTVALTFKAGFEGAKGVYLEVEDYGGLRAVWRQVGTWTVGVNQAPGGLAVNPSSGSGWSQTFQFVASDPNGWQDISWGLMLINRVFSGSGGCYMYFNVGARALLLANDAGTGWIQGVVGSGTIENSQCVVRLSESSFSGEGTTFRVTVALTFKAGFEGAKGVYLEVEDYGGLRAVWRQVGTWTVGVNQAPGGLAVNPSSGSGWSQTFQFVASDPNGWQDISWGLMLINRVFSGSGGCYMYFNVGARALLLANDAGTGWIQGVVGSGTIENSQCVVRLSESSFSGEGTTFRVTVALTFKAGFEGAKGVYLEVEDYGGLRAVWRQVGTWTVGVNQAPGGLAVNPSSGSGWSQTFQFVASDPNGWQDISWGLMLINRVFSGSGGCYMYFNVGARALLLANDAGTGWIQGVVGSGTIENSQCVVRLSESSFSGRGRRSG
jgi:hypothetical protein